MIPIDDLTRPITRAEAYATILDLLASAGVPTTSWHVGAVVRTMATVAAALFAAITSVAAVIHRGTFLDLAEGVWLTLLARLVYNVTRIDATFATGSVTLNNTGGAVFNNVPIGDLIVRNPTTNKLYRNSAVFSLAGNQLGLSVPIEAIEAGSASTSLANTITAFVTTFAGVTCTNPLALVGVDAETDPALRQRCRDSLGASSPNGPTAAFEFYAKSTKRTDGTTVDVNRVKVISSATGLTTVIVADADGPVAGPDVTLISQYLAKMLMRTGDTILVISATAATIAPVGTITVDAACTKTDQEIEDDASTKLAAYFQTVPIGGFQKVPPNGFVYLDALESQVLQATAETIDVDLSSPAGDTALTSTQVPALGVATWTVNRVEQQ